MNKYIIKYIIVLTGLLTFSCEEQLEIDPEQSLSTDVAFADKLTARGSLLGVYSLSQDLDVMGGMPQVIADFQSDNVDFIGSFPTLQDINNYITLSDNTSIQVIWRDHYAAIVAANAVIANIPNVDDPAFSDEEKNQFVAEAKFMRGFLYFQLVNLFADPVQIGGGDNLGVPLVLEPFEGEVDFPERASVNAVHQQIQQDLNQAIASLPSSYSVSDGGRGRATSGATKALLSRLHLYRGEWQQAAALAGEVINEPEYSLAANYEFYNTEDPELIFVIQNSEIDNGATGSGGWASFYSPAELGGRGDAPFSDDLLIAYDPEDNRFANLTQIGDNGRIYTTKFPDAINDSDDAPMIRITEMYLNRAEALIELNGLTGAVDAIDLINPLRERAGLDAFVIADFSTAQDLLDAIREERRKELAFEGHRRMDLLRIGESLRPVGDPNFEESQPGDSRTILPIPQRELDINTDLTQNDGY